MRLRRSVSPQLLNSLMVAGAALLATALVIELDHAVPNAVAVGDIIAFQPDASRIDVTTAVSAGRIAVHRPGQFGCILDLDTLQRDGGSLVTEARLGTDGQTWRMHWAGQRTAPDAGDCGPGADLIVETSDLNRLVVAARGFRIGGFQALGGGQEPTQMLTP